MQRTIVAPHKSDGDENSAKARTVSESEWSGLRFRDATTSATAWAVCLVVGENREHSATQAHLGHRPFLPPVLSALPSRFMLFALQYVSSSDCCRGQIEETAAVTASGSGIHDMSCCTTEFGDAELRAAQSSDCRNDARGLDPAHVRRLQVILSALDGRGRRGLCLDQPIGCNACTGGPPTSGACASRRAGASPSTWTARMSALSAMRTIITRGCI